MDSLEDELAGSVLGTKEHWDKQYAEEVANFQAHGDVGDIWFGEDSVERIVKWINENIDRENSILDIGCGNGIILINLAADNYSNLHGVDYSEPGIKLAQEIAGRQNYAISYEICDMLGDNLKLKLGQDFDVAHDKGTYDAISLNPDDARGKRNKYIKNVASILKSKGLFVLTSCNWTQDELTTHFKEYFQLSEVIPTPQFKFGNQVGNVVTSLVLKKIL